MTDYADDQLADCEALTLAEVQGMGIAGTIAGGAGWNLVDHFCTLGDLEVDDYTGPNGMSSPQDFGRLVPGSVDCDIEWTYDNACSASECPTGGSGGSTSGGMADTGSGGAGAYDCSAFISTNVSWSGSGTSRNAVVRGPITSLLLTEPYTALYSCADATIADSTKKIHDMPSGSILTHLGLLENDVLKSVNGATKTTDMIAEIQDDIAAGIDSTLVVERPKRAGVTTYTYKVEWAL